MASVRDYGAVGDGVTDDTEAIQRAFNTVPHGSVLTFPSGTYVLSREVTVGARVARVTGEGRPTIVMKINDTRCGWLIKAGHQQGLVIEGLLFNVEGTNVNHGAAIYGQDVQGIRIERCEFNQEDAPIQSGAAIVLKGTESGTGCVGNAIRRVKAYVRTGTTKDTPNAIRIDGHLGVVQREYWKANHECAKSAKPAKMNIVEFCDIHGGYYGLMLSSAECTLVQHNTFTGNTRGISAQDCSNYCIIRHNKVLENVSAGIHLAYGSSQNLVQYNQISSKVAHGEGFLQAYVGAKNNVFIGNLTHAEGTGPKYHLYTAVESDGTVFRDNVLEGACLRAYIGVESDWNSKGALPYHRAYNAPNDDNYASKGMGSVVIADNMILAGQSDAKRILMSNINGYNVEAAVFDSHSITRI